MASGSGDAPSLNNERLAARSAKIHNAMRSYESVILYIQRVLVWERPSHSIAFFSIAHAIFCYMTIRSNHAIGFMSSILLLLVLLDLWKHKIWPEIRAVAPDELAEWGELHPRLLSLQEMCQTIAEVTLLGGWAFETAAQFRRDYPGKFCLAFSASCIVLSVIGQKIPGVFLSYAIMMCLMLWPLIWYHRLLEKSYTKIEPFFMQLQYTLRQRSTTTLYLTQHLNTSREALSRKASDEEDDLSDFLPQLDEKTAEVLARAITDDSELSETDEEILAQELPTFSRASTPDNLTANETYLASLPQQFPTVLNDSEDEDTFGLPNPDYNENTTVDGNTRNVAAPLGNLPAQMLANREIVTSAIGTVLKDTFSTIVHKIHPTAASPENSRGSSSSTPNSDFEFIELDNDIQEP